MTSLGIISMGDEQRYSSKHLHTYSWIIWVDDIILCVTVHQHPHLATCLQLLHQNRTEALKKWIQVNPRATIGKLQPKKLDKSGNIVCQSSQEWIIFDLEININNKSSSQIATIVNWVNVKLKIIETHQEFAIWQVINMYSTWMSVVTPVYESFKSLMGRPSGTFRMSTNSSALPFRSCFACKIIEHDKHFFINKTREDSPGQLHEHWLSHYFLPPSK